MKNKKTILLEDIGKELPFSVPEDYFNQFALQIEERIGYKQSAILKFLRPWMYMAAMFVGILIMGQVFYTTHQKNLTINAENYETYVLSQVDESSLVDYYVDEPTK
jgi:hypothetical protein